MKKIAITIAGIMLMAGALMAQFKVKSQKEADAIRAIQSAQDPDGQIAAVENLLLKFRDTEFKAVALQIATGAAQQKGDFEKIILYGERTLQADPKNYTVMLAMASAIAQKTREFDLDKEEKLTTAEKYANNALPLIQAASKPNPDLSDADWENAKKDFTSQAYEALGMAAMARKKYDVAITQFKAGMDATPKPEATIRVRLASAYNYSGKYDEALAILTPLLAEQNLHPAVRQVAGQEKLKAVMGKQKK